jgi:hypothetical protein
MVKKICPKCGFEKAAERFMEFCPNDGTRLLQKPQALHIARNRVQRPDPLFERRRTIKPSELLSSSRWFDDNLHQFQHDYGAAKKLDWYNLSDFSLDLVKRDVLGFLNKWNASGPLSIELNDDIADLLRQVHSETRYIFSDLHNLVIEDLHLYDADGILEQADQLFYRFTNINATFGETLASRILHMIVPAFFVPFDNTIVVAYDLDRYHYESDLLCLMNQKINQTINLAVKEWSCTRDEAIQQLKYQGKTLAKIMDEYNYVEYTKMRKHFSREVRYGQT